MKKGIKIFAMLISAAAILSSCSVTMPVNATSNPVGKKVGTAKATGYFGWIWLDQDASIQAAAKNGGITKISTVDVKYENILNIITSFETVVTGD